MFTFYFTYLFTFVEVDRQQEQALSHWLLLQADAGSTKCNPLQRNHKGGGITATCAKTASLRVYVNGKLELGARARN